MGVGSGTGVQDSGEKDIFNKLKKIKHDNFIIFDIGANRGQFLELTCKSLDDSSFTVHCFEPSVHTFRELKKNAPKNKSIILNNFGLGEKTGVLTLYYDDYLSGLASLTKRDLDFIGIDYSKKESVEIKTLDEYCENNKIEVIDLLKVDVEGHEMDVFKGGINMIQNQNVKMISFEFGGCNVDTHTHFKDFFIFMNKNHYDVYRITPTGYCYKIEKYKEIFEQFRTTNFLAILNKS